MATNGGVLPALTARGLEMVTTTPVAIAIAIAVAYLVLHSLTPSIDPREPPLLKPRIPLIGHIIGMMRHQAHYHITLQRSTGKPIATLPMLTGKMYAVWDPYLIAAGLRSKSLSSTPHIIDATPLVAQVSKPTANLLRGPRGNHIVDRIMHHAIPSAFKPASIQRLNATALAELASQLSTLCASSSTTTKTPIPNAWLWLRHLLTDATGKAVYGAHDPFAKNPAVETALWEFEKNLLKLTLNLPAFLVPVGHRARQVLIDALAPYYAARHDAEESASDFVRNRAAELREAGFPDDDVARVEIMLPFAALANTVPLLFWLFGHVFSRPELVRRLRAEVEEGLVVVSGKEQGEEVVVLSMTAAAMEERCPLLMSCYRETLRRTVHQVSTRTALQDTVLTDRAGREYLLKKGSVVQLAIGASHAVEEYWGPDADEFRPERFLGHNSGGRKAEDGDGPGSAKAMRAAFQPFGGGAHLCPGRNFAFAEMMAVMATLLLGYEVEPLEGTEWKLPGFATRSVIDAVTKPAKHGEGFGVRIGRRQGWEGVRWRYEL
ncbi:cytochrome P450 [Chaetomidium leptoderma]|uniref:Cytochrome P450 n=1 Tax=Chaetomidium leptoderma TaxID=669021 RepID=A0AAN7A064_9PEZI|nr:cytochrome P450 [Chaetomidium leptoderma]